MILSLRNDIEKSILMTLRNNTLRKQLCAIWQPTSESNPSQARKGKIAAPWRPSAEPRGSLFSSRVGFMGTDRNLDGGGRSHGSLAGTGLVQVQVISQIGT